MQIFFRKGYILVLLLLALAGCKKGSPDPTGLSSPVVLSPGLPGTWELRTYVSGNTGAVTNYSSGNGHIVTFTSNTYQVYSGSGLIQSGTYVLAQQYSAISRAMVNTIVYDGVMGTPLQLMDLNGYQLYFTIDGYDTPTSIYAKIK